MKVRLLILLLVLCGVVSCRGTGTSPFATAPPVQDEGWRVEFTGQRVLEATDLRDVLATHLEGFREDGISKTGVDDAAYDLELHYRDQGFPDAYVDYVYRDDGEVVATFEIEEGPRVSIDRIDLVGFRALERDDLLAFFPPIDDGVNRSWYVRGEVRGAVSSLRAYYHQCGFLDTVVEETILGYEGDRVAILVEIEEGTRYTLAARDVTILGRVGVEGERAGTLFGLPQEFLQPEGAPPPPYTRRLAHALRAHVLGRFLDWGYPDCRIEVDPQVEPGAGRVVLDLRVTAGPQVRIAAIELVGNEKTRGSFLRHRLGIEVGDVYDSRAIRDGFGRLYATGLFESVTIDLAPSTEVDRTLVVTVVELPSIEIFVEPGYGSYEGPRLRFGVEDQNVVGRGRTLRAESTVGGKAQSLKVGFLERAFFRTDVQASARAFASHREEPSYTLEERGAGIELSHAWPKHDLLASIGYRFRATVLKDVDIVDPVAQELLEDVDVSSVSASITRDTRDNPLIPTRGNRARVSVELASKALGSEVDFLAAHVEDAHFFPLPWEGGVLGLSARTGVIEPIGDTNLIPLQLRRFNGGENTVRSFKEDELGPRDSTGEPLGGEAYSVFSAELRQDLWAGFSGAVFIDTGNVSPTVEDWSSFDEMRTAIGVGVRYLLPIGPLRLDVGHNPTASDDEDDYVVHFSVGMAF